MHILSRRDVHAPANTFTVAIIICFTDFIFDPVFDVSQPLPGRHSGIGRNILCVTDTENITRVPQELKDLCPYAYNVFSTHKVYPLR